MPRTHKREGLNNKITRQLGGKQDCLIDINWQWSMDSQSIAELSAQAGYDGVENVVHKHLGVLAKEMPMSGGETLPSCTPSVQRPQGSHTRTDTKVCESPHS